MVGLQVTLTILLTRQALMTLYMKGIKRDETRAKIGNLRIKICYSDIIYEIEASVKHPAASAKEFLT